MSVVTPHSLMLVDHSPQVTRMFVGSLTVQSRAGDEAQGSFATGTCPVRGGGTDEFCVYSEVVGAGAPPSEVDLRSVPEVISVQGVRIAARCDAPVVAPTTKGAKRKALEAAGSGQAKESALAASHREMNAQSAVAPRDSLLKAWLQFHSSWFGHGQEGEGEAVDSFPLTVLEVVP